MTTIAEMGIARELAEDYEAVLARLPDTLKAEGFGVITEVDVTATLREKLGVEFRRYKILGACNPAAAHRVLSLEPEIGLLLPCNVVVYDMGGGKTRVSAFDPMQMVEGQDAPPEMAEVASDIRNRMQRVVAAL